MLRYDAYMQIFGICSIISTYAILKMHYMQNNKRSHVRSHICIKMRI